MVQHHLFRSGLVVFRRAAFCARHRVRKRSRRTEAPGASVGHIIANPAIGFWPDMDRRYAYLRIRDVLHRFAAPLRTATAQAVRGAMGEGAGVLVVNSHGDGVDIFLGQSLALCPLDRSAAEADRRRAPSCCVRDFCHRFGQPTEQITGTDRVMSPDDVRARVALFDVCYGVLAADSIIDHRWALGPRSRRK